MSPPIDFDRLVADYRRGLVDRLRHFEAGAAEFLALWVPAEDPLDSLRNLLDAAAEASEAEIEVAFGTAIDTDALHRIAEAFGEATVEADARGTRLRVTGLHRPAAGRPAPSRPRAVRAGRAATPATSAEPAGAVYDAGIETALAHVAHEGEPPADPACVRVTAGSAGARLVLDVEPETHVVRRAAFAGAPDGTARALLERLCALIEGTPIQDASDHGVIRLEHALRGRGGARPVAGVVTPASAGPAFRLPQTLVRAALADYRAKTGYAGIANEFDPGPSAAWRALDDAERRRRLAATIAGVEAGAEVVAIEHDVRVVVRFAADLSADAKQRAMMALESAIKQKLDPRLELHHEELTDANVIRRLSDAGEPR